ncbi:MULTISPECIES: flagellar hook-length control protein FliK [unclassified Halomonas]|uniref:flagellar hook-length control protein FliK n=1 Tax=unclassified Halomonas TaxID=2609666 RepID=UPI001BE9D805|nr:MULTISPECIES: flagellar hook-length control protein FliK [unclassified Halomonas]MBT2785911.1 flagellar hook-length control protein FliK [Halomonas sp. ISL-106]MBT2799201.1 flagellar hook-length control protein FliK [Halomonas sp. ISL-104]
MNIHQLLSVSQSSPQTQSPGAFNRQDPVNGLFHQALLQASDTQRLSAGLSKISAPQAPLQQGQDQLNALGTLVSAGLEVDVENLSAALERLGLDVSESDFSKLLAQLQLPNSDISANTLGLNDGQVSTSLDEIAGRLALMASFTGSSSEAQLTSSVAPATLRAIAEQLNISQTEDAQLVDTPALKTIIHSLSMDNSGSVQSINPAILEAIADQLNITQTEAAQLVDTPALKTIIQSFSMDNSGSVQSIDPAALQAIADQLNIDQTEAAQLASALNGLVGQQQEAQTLPVDSARLTDARSSVAERQIAPRQQPDTFVTQLNSSSASPQINTSSAAPNVSSEALMGALLAADGTPKGSQSGEQLPIGFSFNTSSNPLAMPQSAQTYTPAPTPTAATLTTPFMSPAWSQQLSQQLVQFSQRGGDQHVQMQLNPAELGPLSISLKFSEQGAQAHFLSAHAQVRQVLEQAIPQLREALAEQGISLGETSVGEQRDPNDQAFAQSSSKNGIQTGSDSGEIGLDEAAHQSAGSNPLALDGRVDLYA